MYVEFGRVSPYKGHRVLPSLIYAMVHSYPLTDHKYIVTSFANYHGKVKESNNQLVELA